MPQFVAPATATDDASLLRRITAGDSQALAWLYQRDAPRMFRYCMAMAHDEALASDAVQDTFVDLAAQAQGAAGAPRLGFDPQKGALNAYLLGVARHHLLAGLRSAGRYLSSDAHVDSDLEPWEPATEAHHALDPLNLQVQRQSSDALLKAVAALPFAFREAVVLVDLQEATYEEAATLTGVPLNTIRTRLHRGRARLAKALGAEPSGNSKPHAVQ
jgi:RNA polymerase sigma-70 factor, ECF subfamily